MCAGPTVERGIFIHRVLACIAEVRKAVREIETAKLRTSRLTAAMDMRRREIGPGQGIISKMIR